MGLRSVRKPNLALLDRDRILEDLRETVASIAQAILDEETIHAVCVAPFDEQASGLWGDFLYKPGLAGGQHARGGTATSDDLEFSANANAFGATNTGRIRLHERVEFAEDFSISASFAGQALIKMLGNLSVATGLWQWSGFITLNDIGWTSGPVLVTAPTFDCNTRFEPRAAVSATSSAFAGFWARQNVRTNHASGTSTLDNVVGFDAVMDTETEAAAGTTNITNWTCFGSYGFGYFGTRLAGARYTISNYRGLWVGQPSKGGVTVTNQIGVDINDLTQGATLNLSLRSAGDAVEMRHAGPAVFGLNGAPNVFADCAKDFATRAAATALANGTNNDVNATDRSLLRVTGPTAAFTITGFTDGQNGKYLVVRNTTANAMTIAHENAGSAAANRINTPSGGNVVLAASVSTAWFIYDATSARWILLAARDSGGPK